MEIVAGRVDRRPAGLDRRAQHERKIDWLRLHLDQAPGDPRHLEQVVDQAHEVADLTLHQLAARARSRSPRRRPSSAAARRSAAAPAGCAARGPASPGTRPCGGRPGAATLRRARARPGARESGTGARGRAARCAPRVTSVARRTGRSSSVTLPSVRTASIVSAESAPGRVRIRIGRSDQGGCAASTSPQRGQCAPPTPPPRAAEWRRRPRSLAAAGPRSCDTPRARMPSGASIASVVARVLGGRGEEHHAVDRARILPATAAALALALDRSRALVGRHAGQHASELAQRTRRC